MASKAPPIPPQQRTHSGQKPDLAETPADRRDASTGAQSGQPGDADVNLKLQGRHGNRRQNVDDVQHKQQAR